MTTVDTNVVVRFLVRDDPGQAERTRALFEDEQRDIVVLDTVLLETEWVLRAAYGFDRDATAEAFRKLLGLPTVRPEDPQRAYQTLMRYSEGLDFADALHWTGSLGADALKTFDRRFAGGADNDDPCPVEVL